MRSLLASILFLWAVGPAFGQGLVGTCEPGEAEAFLDVGNVRARIINTGNLWWRGSPNVYEVPKGSGVNGMFVGGIWLGGFVGGELRMAAARYGRYEYWPGPLDDAGRPPEDCTPFDRIYSVRRSDIEGYHLTGQATADLRDWPTGLGAPTLDADGNQVDLAHLPFAERRLRQIDLAGGESPDMVGDQMIWFILNDRGNVHTEAETEPIGVEVHVTAFAFERDGAVGDATFYRHRIVYRGVEPLEDAYLGLFADPDVGYFDDDFIGSDTTLGVGYAYNGDNDDESAYGSAPPALGIDFLRGPIVPGSSSDSAWVDGRLVGGQRHLDMAHLMRWALPGFFNPGPASASDYYNFMRARWKDGRKITEGGHGLSFSTEPVDLLFPGDPVTGAFWSEIDQGNGYSNSPGDRQFVMSAGPFRMEPDDQQDILWAVIWARGTYHLDSVSELRRADRVVQRFADRNFLAAPPPPSVGVRALLADDAVTLRWDGTSEADEYSVYDPFTGGEYRFQGYNVYRFDSALDSVGTRVATYDLVDGITRVIDGLRDEPTSVNAHGTDSGIQYSHTFGGLSNHQTYHFGVSAYGVRDIAGYPRVIEGPIARVSAEPRGEAEGLDQAGVVPNPYVGTSAYERAPRLSEARFVNLPLGTKVRVFTLSGALVRELVAETEGPLRWDLTNTAGLRVGSGMYLVHLEHEAAGSKVLRFAVVRRKP